jgi:hypothetical protein
VPFFINGKTWLDVGEQHIIWDFLEKSSQNYKIFLVVIQVIHVHLPFPIVGCFFYLLNLDVILGTIYAHDPTISKSNKYCIKVVND